MPLVGVDGHTNHIQRDEAQHEEITAPHALGAAGAGAAGSHTAAAAATTSHQREQIEHVERQCQDSKLCHVDL